MRVWCGVSDEAEVKEVKEESVKVAVKKHESALITEQSKMIDLQTLIDSRDEVGPSLQHSYQNLVTGWLKGWLKHTPVTLLPAAVATSTLMPGF